MGETSLTVLSEKTGFEASGSVRVLYPDGSVFYAIDKKGPFQFNLPKGRYIFQTPVKRLARPVVFQFKSKRKVEKNIPLPGIKDLKIEYGDNPNKATIFLKEFRILFDNQFKTAAPVIKDYLLYHEIGHFLYKSEEFADEFAQESLIRLGYPESLVYKASRDTLSPGNPRAYQCFENLKNIKKR